MNIIAFIILYLVIAIITFFVVNFMIMGSLTDEEFIEFTENNSARLLALLVVSAFWPICVPIIILNNIFNKGVD